MRFLSATVGVLTALASTAATYFFFIFAMFVGGGTGNVRAVVLCVLFAFLLAALINLVAGLLNPRKPATPRLLLASAILWLLAGAFFGIVAHSESANKDLLLAVELTALLVAPALLPLAAWALVRWNFTSA